MRIPINISIMECHKDFERCSNNPGFSWFWSKQADSEAKDCSLKLESFKFKSIRFFAFPCRGSKSMLEKGGPKKLLQRAPLSIGKLPNLALEFGLLSPWVQMCMFYAGRKMVSPTQTRWGWPTGRERKNMKKLIELDQKMAHSWI